MKTLPAGLAHYKSTPEFTQDSMPAGLRRSHTTAAGVWGRIVVLEGTLRYRITGAALPETHVLMPGSPGIVEPQVEHEVEPVGNVRFLVEFHRAT